MIGRWSGTRAIIILDLNCPWCGGRGTVSLIPIEDTWEMHCTACRKTTALRVEMKEKEAARHD